MSIGSIKRAIHSAHLSIKSGIIFRSSLLKQFAVWSPNALDEFLYPTTLVKNANLYPSTLYRLQQCVSSDNFREVEILHSQSFGKLNIKLTDCLSSLFNSYGSDKAAKHDYFLVYSDFFDELGPNKKLKVLEIGMGTNNPHLISTMGVNGKPGASLRAFRDALPFADIYGADIDKNILFEEERIKTAWVDQFEQDSFIAMTDSLGEKKFNLIIDDGLHAVSANLNSLIFSINSLEEGGIFVVEDIPERSLDAWLPIILILHDKYNCGLIKCKREYLFFLSMKKNRILNNYNE